MERNTRYNISFQIYYSIYNSYLTKLNVCSHLKRNLIWLNLEKFCGGRIFFNYYGFYSVSFWEHGQGVTKDRGPCSSSKEEDQKDI